MKAILWVAVLVALLPATWAINIGASPGTVQLNSMAKGGYGEQELLITTNSEVNVTGHIDFGGEIGPWVRLFDNQTTFVFSRVRPFATRVVIEPPFEALHERYCSPTTSASTLIATEARTALPVVPSTVRKASVTKDMVPE